MQIAEIAKTAAAFVYRNGPMVVVLSLYAGIFSSQFNRF